MHDEFILFVDDTPANARMFTTVLRSQGFTREVIAVGDGVEALDFLFCRGEYGGRDCERQPCLIILDLDMPRMDGLETLKKIREDEWVGLLPVVVMTSSGQPENKVKAYRLGANGYVDKASPTVPFPETAKRIVDYWVEVNQPALPVP